MELAFILQALYYRLKIGKGYFIDSFSTLLPSNKAHEEKCFIFIVSQGLDYEIIPSLWPILSHLNP